MTRAAPRMPRAGRAGDVYVLVAGPPSDPALLAQLREAWGGAPVTPLHLTVDRLVPGDPVEDARAALARVASGIAPFPVVAAGVLPMASRFRGGRILKARIRPDPRVEGPARAIDEALRGLGVARAFDPSREVLVTVLEGIHDVPRPSAVAFPRELFVAERILLSRIRDVGDYEIVADLALARG